MRVLRLGLVAGIVAFLTVCGVVIDSGPARALDAPTPTEIKTTTKMLAPSVARRVLGGAAGAGAAAACSTGVGCAAVLLVTGGLIAYETQDVWVPWVKNAIGEDTKTQSGNLSDFGGAEWLVPPRADRCYVLDNFSGDNCQGVPAVKWMSGANPEWPKFRGWKNYGDQSHRMLFRHVAECRGITLGNWTSWQTVTGGSYEVADNAGGDSVIDPLPSACTGGNAVQWRQIEIQGQHQILGNNDPVSWSKLIDWKAAQAVENTDVTVTCRRPDGSTYTRTAFTDQPGDLIAAPHCDAGDTAIATGLRVNGTPQQTLDLQPDGSDAQNYPQCALQACYYAIFVDGSKCEVISGIASSAGCHSWSTLARSADPLQQDRVQCKYGPYTVEVDLCWWLERVYENGRSTATKQNTDGVPDTYTPPAPAPYSNPSPSPSSTTTGQPTPTPTPSGLPEPCTAGQACVGPPQSAPAAQCWPNGWAAFNPAEWVLQPLRCAFIPRTEKVNEVKTRVGLDVQTSGVGPLVDAVGDPIEALASGDGCSGIQFDLPIGGQTFHGSILNACSGSMATAAHISSALIGLSTVLGGGMALLRLAGAGFGYNVKVSDGD